MIEIVIYYFKLLLGIFLGVQWVFVFLFSIIEWAMVDYYRLGTFEKPTSIFDKVTNFGMAYFMGSGYFLYSKFEKYNWITRKFYMLISVVVHGILCLIVYYIITIPIDWIFL